MGFFRFRRSVKIAPGVRLNVSKSGVSTSIGPRGAKVTIGHGQVRETAGIPGTGLSYTETHRTGSTQRATPQGDASTGVGAGAVFVAIAAALVIAAAGGSIAYGLLAAIAVFFLAQIVKGYHAGAADTGSSAEPFSNQAELEAMKTTFEHNKVWLHERLGRAEQAKASGKLGEFPRWYFDSATQPQLEHLTRMHVKVTDTELTKGSASDLIGIFEPMDEGDAEVLRFFHVDVSPEQRNETRGRMEVARIFADPLNRTKWEERATSKGEV